jgi:hypothetical protein
MTDEDRLHHDDFCNKMVTDLAPVGSVETFHATSAAEEAWTLHNARAHRNNLIAIGHFDYTGDWYVDQHPEVETALTAAQVVRDRAKTLELLSLYEQRIHRAFQKHFDQLKKLQAEREAKNAADLDDACKLSQLAKLNELPYIPAQDGFVYSTEEIDRYTDRVHRLTLAKEANTLYRHHVNLWELPKQPPQIRKAA